MQWYYFKYDFEHTKTSIVSVNAIKILIQKVFDIYFGNGVSSLTNLIDKTQGYSR